jgi:hypothetical protein
VVHVTGLPDTAIEVSVRPALDHQSNRLHDVRVGGRHLILKEYLRADEQQIAPVREFQALRRLAPLDIAPQPVFYDSALGPYVLYEYMAGEMWTRHQPGPTELAQLADLWLRVHSVPLAGLPWSRGYERSLAETANHFAAIFQRFADWTTTNFPAGRWAADLCLRLLDERRAVGNELSETAPVFCFCKADQRFANVIRRPDGRLGQVDWEDSGLRDPARDLADLLTHSNQEDLLSFEEWQPFLQSYLSHRRAQDPGLAHRLHLYLGIFPIFWLTILIDQGMRRADAGQLAGWAANELSPNLRLRRYLARALAWPEMNFAHQLETLDDLRFFPKTAPP